MQYDCTPTSEFRTDFDMRYGYACPLRSFGSKNCFMVSGGMAHIFLLRINEEKRIACQYIG